MRSTGSFVLDTNVIAAKLGASVLCRVNGYCTRCQSDFEFQGADLDSVVVLQFPTLLDLLAIDKRPVGAAAVLNGS